MLCTQELSEAQKVTRLLTHGALVLAVTATAVYLTEFHCIVTPCQYLVVTHRGSHVN